MFQSWSLTGILGSFWVEEGSWVLVVLMGVSAGVLAGLKGCFRDENDVKKMRF